MKHSTINRGIPAGNPLANIFVVIVGALAIGASIVLGFFAFVILGSIVLMMAAVIGLRVWWFKRKMQGQTPPGGKNGGDASAGGTGGGVIEGEYQVVADDRDGE